MAASLSLKLKYSPVFIIVLRRLLQAAVRVVIQSFMACLVSEDNVYLRGYRGYGGKEERGYVGEREEEREGGVGRRLCVYERERDR